VQYQRLERAEGRALRFSAFVFSQAGALLAGTRSLELVPALRLARALQERAGAGGALDAGASAQVFRVWVAGEEDEDDE